MTRCQLTDEGSKFRRANFFTSSMSKVDGFSDHFFKTFAENLNLLAKNRGFPQKPPPAAPPLMPNVGPCDGWRRQAKAFLPAWAPNAWAKPMVVVDLPSPSGVGVMPATRTAFN
uniref:Uncharacterized protein n=1 Tax=Romanomermis culicivorax TaxID=13658 RepID=A0A915K760_ROMCU